MTSRICRTCEAEDARSELQASFALMALELQKLLVSLDDHVRIASHETGG